MPEAIQDRPPVSDFHKALNVALEDNIIRKPASLFCIALNSLSALLDKIAYGYRLKSGTTINPFLYMDDIKLHVYAKNEQDINSLIYFTWVFSPDIGITVGLAKCGRPIVDKARF